MTHLNEVCDALMQLREDRFAELAEKGYEALRAIFSQMPERWGNVQLGQLHEGNRANVLRLLRGEHALCGSAQELYVSWTGSGVRPDHFRDPSMLTDIASLLSLLLKIYVAAFTGDNRQTIEDVITAALDSIAQEFVAVCRPQVRAIEQMVSTTLHEAKVVRDSARLLLVELPVGNLIPLRLLHHFLRKQGCRVETVQVPLCRNDSASHGMTRKEMLKDRLQGAIRGGDLVVLVDEWLSGANFKTITQYVGAIVRAVPNASFLPIAMLADYSSTNEHYLSCVRAHKKLLKEFGFGSEKTSRFRIQFPPLEVLVSRGDRHYFFWSEHDRLTGTRKVYPAAMCFAAVDAAVETLMKDPERWREALLRMLMHMAPAMRAESGLPTQEDENDGLFDIPLEKCYEDYTRIKGELQAVQHACNLGRCDDPVQAFREIRDALMQKIEGRPASICVGLGLALVEDDFLNDSWKPRVRREHTPILVEVESPQRWFHDRLMEKLVAAIEV